MKNANVHAKKIGPLIKKIAKQYPAGDEGPLTRDPVSHVIYGFLEWEANSQSAEAVMTRLDEIAVDHNDLRVCHTAEMIEAMGQRYPRAEERAARLREVLNGIYMLEHDTSLAGVEDRSKRDIRQYMDSLPGMVPYVSSRMLLVAFGGHAIPVDERLVSLLDQAKVIEPGATVEEVSSFLERHIKASDAMEAHMVFRRWADEAPVIKMKPVKLPKPVKVSKPVVKAAEEVAKETPVVKTSKAAGGKSKATEKPASKVSKTSSKATASKSKASKTTKKKVTKKAPVKKAGAKSGASKTTKKKSSRKAKK